MNLQNLYNDAVMADQKGKADVMISFLHACINSYERGELTMYWIGSRTIGVLNTIERPSVKLFMDRNTDPYRYINSLYSVAGRMDMSEQGEASKRHDEALWTEFKDTVQRLSADW